MTIERDRLARLRKAIERLHWWDQSRGWVSFNAILAEIDEGFADADRLIAAGVTVPASVPADPPQSVSTTADSPALNVERLARALEAAGIHDDLWENGPATGIAEVVAREYAALTDEAARSPQKPAGKAG